MEKFRSLKAAAPFEVMLSSPRPEHAGRPKQAFSPACAASSPKTKVNEGNRDISTVS